MFPRDEGLLNLIFLIFIKKKYHPSTPYNHSHCFSHSFNSATNHKHNHHRDNHDTVDNHQYHKMPPLTTMSTTNTEIMFYIYTTSNTGTTTLKMWRVDWIWGAGPQGRRWNRIINSGNLFKFLLIKNYPTKLLFFGSSTTETNICFFNEISVRFMATGWFFVSSTEKTNKVSVSSAKETKKSRSFPRWSKPRSDSVPWLQIIFQYLFYFFFR